jgi:hypothetical protein
MECRRKIAELKYIYSQPRQRIYEADQDVRTMTLMLAVLSSAIVTIPLTIPLGLLWYGVIQVPRIPDRFRRGACDRAYDNLQELDDLLAFVEGRRSTVAGKTLDYTSMQQRKDALDRVFTCEDLKNVDARKVTYDFLLALGYQLM